MSLDALMLNEGRRIAHLHDQENGVDTLFNSGSHRTSYLTAPRKITLETQATAAFGRDLDFKLINSGNYAYGECLLKCTFDNTSTANYSSYLSMSMIERVQLISGDNRVIMDYQYQPVMKAIMQGLKAEEKAHLLTGLSDATEGTAIANEEKYALIPLFWSRYFNPSGEDAKPFPLYLCAGGDMTVRITIRSLANCLLTSATGGGLSTAQLVCYVQSVNAETALMHKAQVDRYEYHTAIPKTLIGNSVADSTATNINIKSLAGHNIVKLTFTSAPAADRDSASFIYFENDVSVDSYKLEVNNDDVHEVGDVKEGIVDKVIMGKYNENTDTFYVIPFSQYNDPRIYSGALNTSNLQTFTLKEVTQTTGATVYVDVCAWVHASYSIKNGNVKLNYS